jgi:hypothetical protein
MLIRRIGLYIPHIMFFFGSTNQIFEQTQGTSTGQNHRTLLNLKMGDRIWAIPCFILLVIQDMDPRCTWIMIIKSYDSFASLSFISPKYVYHIISYNITHITSYRLIWHIKHHIHIPYCIYHILYIPYNSNIVYHILHISYHILRISSHLMNMTYSDNGDVSNQDSPRHFGTLLWLLGKIHMGNARAKLKLGDWVYICIINTCNIILCVYIYNYI